MFDSVQSVLNSSGMKIEEGGFILLTETPTTSINGKKEYCKLHTNKNSHEKNFYILNPVIDMC